MKVEEDKICMGIEVSNLDLEVHLSSPAVKEAACVHNEEENLCGGLVLDRPASAENGGQSGTAVQNLNCRGFCAGENETRGASDFIRKGLGQLDSSGGSGQLG